jgi:hypothetical protein
VPRNASIPEPRVREHNAEGRGRGGSSPSLVVDIAPHVLYSVDTWSGRAVVTRGADRVTLLCEGRGCLDLAFVRTLQPSTSHPASARGSLTSGVVRRWTTWALILAVSVLAGFVLLLLIPRHVVASSPEGVTWKKRMDARNDVRVAAVQLVGFTVLLLGTGFTVRHKPTDAPDRAVRSRERPACERAPQCGRRRRLRGRVARPGVDSRSRYGDGAPGWIRSRGSTRGADGSEGSATDAA